MTERHYGHLEDDHITKEIRASPALRQGQVERQADGGLMAKRISPLTKADHDGAERLKQDWRDRLASLAEAGRRLAPRTKTEDNEYQWIKACFAAAGGDQSALLDWLRSDRPLPDLFREDLADLISGKRFHRRAPRGRPENMSMSQQLRRALFARMFYREWREENQKGRRQ